MRLFLPLLTTCLIILAIPLSVHAYDLSDSGPSTCDLCGNCFAADGTNNHPGDWGSCRTCIYGGPDPTNFPKPTPGKTWTPIGCIDTNAGSFVQNVLRFVLGIAGGLTFLGILWGGFQLVTASGDPIRVSSGKNTIVGSIGAILLLLFAVFLLQFIGVTVIGLPGFGG